MEEPAIRVKVDVKLVHDVLMSDPSDFSSLAPQMKRPTPEYQEFCSSLLHDAVDPVNVMKRAYHDNLVETVERTQNYQPLKGFILELHGAIRSLVPNRPELHSLLDDSWNLPESNSDWSHQRTQLFSRHVKAGR